MTENIISVIPARGGSMRLPHKNIKPIAGKPMIAWTIEAALKTKIFSEVYVDTDDQEIANVSMDCGACVPFLRDTVLAQDNISVQDAIYNFVKKINLDRNDTIIKLGANCPCRTSFDIFRAYQVFEMERMTSLISAFNPGFAVPWWALKLQNGCPTPAFKRKMLKKRSQDLPPVFIPSGAIWISKVSTLLISKTFYSKGYKLFSLPMINAVDIDTLEDFRLAENEILRRAGNV